ncbi:Serine/threonine exchanger SteT [uncultured Eubacterium sp.]|uniref:APC family permease n=1 Tax=Brotomerdimonas butyrica TaxID=2981721 RepID=UPI000821977E|nr:APC family permease [Brotomerdimonas butyrica]MCU6755252.1 APC family permease [Brotomerdimonas butyrica]SCH19986.1 Serine/threonine exchanger SteT [uncultured Eubacterium sp.]
MSKQQSGGLVERNITLRTAVLMMYCLVAAGAFGIEGMISDAGPGMTIVILCVLPFIWAAPQALCSAELGSFITDAGGFYKWIQRGLGEFWGFAGGWCRTVSCYIDNTLYIVLAGSYSQMLIPGMTDTAKFIFMFVLILIFTVINLLGIEEVGKVSTIFSVIIFIAFMAVTVVGFANWQYNPMEPFYNSADYTLIGSIGAGLATGMWMYAGYTSMSTLATECKDKSVIPRGLLIIMPLVAISYILPTIAGLASVGQWQDWANDGAGISFGNVLALAGAWGLPCFTIAAVIANLSLFNTQMISISRGFYGMALDNLAPKVLLKVSKKRHVPYIGVISLSVVTTLLCNFDFSVLVTMDVTMLMVDYVLVFISAARLRKIEPDTPRPFKIPFGDNFVKILITPGLIIACAALFLNGADYYLGGMIAFASAPILYVIWKRMYGGLYANDPVKYPIDKRTRLVSGDFSRMAIVFAILAVIGLIGGLFWFDFYEVGWEADYGANYPFLGGTDEEITNRIYNSITVVSVIYAVLAIVLRICDKKLEKKELPAETAAE